MHAQPVDDYALYRHRYGFAYTVLAVLTVILLTLNFTSLPPGLSQAEQASALVSSRLNLTFESITAAPKALLEFLQHTNTVDLPYHLLQKYTLETFGLSPLGVRLPSLLLAGASIGALFILLQRLIRAKSAIVASLLIATSSWFISLGRLGTPDIMIVFWTVSLLLLTIAISQQAKQQHLWRLLVLVSLGLALYTPGTALLVATIAIAAVLQPHLRYLVRRIHPANAMLGVVLTAAILMPLGFTLWHTPTVGLSLLHIPIELPTPMDFFANFFTAFSALLNPLAISFNGAPQPLVALPIAALALIGAIRLVKDWHSVRSHVLLIWLALLLPLIGLSRSYTLTFLFMPLMLLAAIGVQNIIQYWYTLFPRNPYARIFGLLPLGLLLVVVIQFNYQRYFQALPYAKETVSLYDQDPFLLTQTLWSKQYRDKHIQLVVPADKVELYKINTVVAPKLTVYTPDTFKQASSTSSIIVAEEAVRYLSEQDYNDLKSKPVNLLVNSSSKAGMRFRAYEL